jgi:L-fucose mutarotase/ribose pyranase (RbsD/FucU family)
MRSVKVAVLEVSECDKSKNVDLSIWKEYQKILDTAEGKPVKMEVISRERFYERAKNTYAIVLSG